jgi:hypothetical protein
MSELDAMSNYRDDPYLRHRYDEIDRQHADTQRMINDDITWRAIEISRLDREIERRKRADELDKIRSSMESDRASAVKYIESASSLPQECKDEWRRSLERIPLICPEAGEELNSLVAKIERYRKEKISPPRPDGIFGPSPLVDFPWNFRKPSFNAAPSMKRHKSEPYPEDKEVEKAQIGGHRKKRISLLDGIFGPDSLTDFSWNFRTLSANATPRIERRETEHYQEDNEMEKIQIDGLLLSVRVVIATRSLYFTIRSRPI